MKKSTIWLLTIVMAITFGALLYFQIMYLENMVKMREAQFSENVMRSLYATAGYLEREETLHFLEEDVNIIEPVRLLRRFRCNKLFCRKPRRNHHKLWFTDSQRI